MNLDELFVAPQMSSTMSSKDNSNSSDNKTNVEKQISQDEGGRPELPDDEKSEKTIRNKESEA